MRFVTDPDFRRGPRGNLRLVTSLDAIADGRRLHVPAGFLTDGASIPPLMWPVVGHPYSPSSLRAAILHDWLCRNPDAHAMPSPAVHRLFYASLRADGVAWLRAWAMWLAVRVFGPRF